MNISSFLFSLFLITTFLGCDEPKKEVEAPQNEATSEDRLFVIDDATLGVDAKGLLTAAWVVEGAAGSIASFEAVIGKNQDCSEVEEQLSIESEQNSLSYQFKNSGVFYLCMFATTSDEQKIAASNNGLKIEVKLPVEISKLESQVHQTQVDWVQPEGLLTFNLEASKTIDFDADVKLVESVKSPFVYAELEPEAEYFFRLSTIVGEDVAVSAIKSIKTLPLPVVPENFALQAGNASLEVSWDFKPDHTYEVHYADNDKFEGVQVLKAENSPLAISALANNVNYFVKINALYQDGKSNLTEVLSATPQPVPAMPINFSASAGNTDATLAWDAVSNAIKYEIYWSLNTPVTVDDNKIVAATNSFTQINLTNGTRYYYRVAARNPVGLSPLSIEKSTQPGVAPSVAPIAVSAQVGPAELTLDWQPVAGGESYEIFYKGTTGVTDGDTKLTSTTDSYVHMGLTNSQTYYYKVRAINSLGVGPLSAEFSGTPIPLPTVPNTITAVGNNASNLVTWSAAAGATSYNLYYKATNAGVNINSPQISGVTSPYSHTGLVNGTTYFYRVEAVNAAGSDGLSSEVSAVPGIAPASAPTGVSAAAGDAQANLTWNAVAGATSYEIYFKTSPSVTTSDTKIDAAANSHLHASLSNGTTYYYKVRAKNAYGTGSFSSEFDAAPLAPPAAPGSPAASDGNASTSVTWSNSATAASYNIYFKTSSGVAKTDTKLTNVTSPYSHTGLSNGTTYYYKIEAVNVGGGSSLSTEVSAAAVAAPVAPSPVASSGDTENTITWNAVTGASSYNLYFATATGLTSASGSAITGVSSTYTHTGLANGTAYYYVMRAVGAGGNSPDSSEVTATPDAPPVAPTNVRLVKGHGSLTVYWDEVAGADSYNVVYGTGYAGSLTDVQPGVVLENVAAAYTPVKVEAVNTVGTSPYSGVAQSWPGGSEHEFIKVSTGDYHACAIDENHDAYCWSMVSQITAGPIAGYGNTLSMAHFGGIQTTGDGMHGILARGNLTDYDTLGNPNPSAEYMLRADISESHACSIDRYSKLYCWGNDDSQQIGDGSNQDNPDVVTAIDASTTVIDIAVGNNHSCRITTDGDLQCWGSNALGQAGTRFLTSEYDTPANSVSTYGLK